MSTVDEVKNEMIDLIDKIVYYQEKLTSDEWVANLNNWIKPLKTENLHEHCFAVEQSRDKCIDLEDERDRLEDRVEELRKALYESNAPGELCPRCFVIHASEGPIDESETPPASNEIEVNNGME